MHLEIRIGGFGGQGVIRTGLILATAASIYGNKYAAQTTSYGPESRGGRCKSDVIISSKEIDFPKIYDPDVLIALSQEAYTDFSKDLKKDSLILLDPDLVSYRNKLQQIRTYEVPATRIAQKLGKKIITNVVMIGAFVAITGFLKKEEIIETVKQNIPKAFQKINLKAFKKGYEFGKKITEK